MEKTSNVFVVSFDTNNTVLRYFTDDENLVFPGVAESNVYRGKLLSLFSYSQSLDPVHANSDIGAANFVYDDSDKSVSSLINAQMLLQRGLRGKRVQHWTGLKGNDWGSDYKLQQTLQFYKGVGWQRGGLQFFAEDIQRSTLVDIFDVKKTTLTASLPLTTTTINVNSTSGFNLIKHGASYSDAPNVSVGYVKVDDEYIRWTAKTATTFTIDNVTTTLNGAVTANATTITLTSATNFRTAGSGYIDDLTAGVKYPITWTGKSGNQLTGVTGILANITTGENVYDMIGRGVLNTRPADHSVDTNKPADKRKKIEECIYYELPFVKLAYAILTGGLYGSADTIPTHHSLGISTDWIATSQFISIGSDIWDPSDDTAGKICRFVGLKKTNAKKFIEEKLNFPIGLFNPILNTGEYGLKRMAAIMPDAAYTRLIKPDDILGINKLFWDFDDIHNEFIVNWNHKEIVDDYTRSVLYIDQDSIDTYGSYKPFVVNARGLHGSRYTDNIIGTLINVWRNRHAGPPLKMSLELDYSFRNLKVGQIVRVEVDQIPEWTDENGNYENLAISAEVQKVSIDHSTARVSVELFASTRKAAPIALGTGTSLADSWYTSQGSDISGVGTVTGSTAGSVFTITANSSLTGVTDLNSATATSDNDQGIFYWNGDLTIASGVILTITNNVELRVKGTFTNNGTIDGKGRGIVASAGGTAGAIGSTKAGGGVYVHELFGLGLYQVESFDTSVAEGTTHQAGPFLIDPGTNGATVTGRPGDLRGTSGGTGANIIEPRTGALLASGQAGGAGGAGLSIFCRGAVGGASSSINLSGDDGTDGVFYSSAKLYSGSGAGGYGGGLALFLDGDTVTNTLTDYFVSNLGASRILGDPLSEGYQQISIDYPRSSHYYGFQAESKSVSNLWIDFIPVPQTPAEDTYEQASLASAISVTAQAVTLNTVNLIGLEISVTAPSDTNYAGSRIYIKKSTDTEYSEPKDAYGNQEVVFWVTPDGSTYDIKAHSLSIDGVESNDYISRSFTVDNGQVVQMPDGSSLVGAASMAGSAADETLVPNGFFDFPITGTWRLSEGSAPATTPTINNDVTEGNYLNLPNDTGGYAYGSRTFRLIPGSKYRFRIRAKHDGTGTEDGFYFRLQYKDTYTDLITNSNRDGINDFIAGATALLTTSYLTYEFDYIIPSDANWGNIALYNYTQSAVGFQVVFVDVIPLFSLTDSASYGDDNYFDHVKTWVSIDGLYNVTIGSGTVETLNGLLRCSVTTAANDLANSNKNVSYPLKTYNWTNDSIKLKFCLYIFNLESTCQASFGIGNNAPGGSANGIGFFYDAGTWKAFVKNSGTNTTANLTATPVINDILEVQLDRKLNEARFYVNGTLDQTITTGLPTGDFTLARYIPHVWLKRNSTGTVTSRVGIGETKIRAGYK